MGELLSGAFDVNVLVDNASFSLLYHRCAKMEAQGYCAQNANFDMKPVRSQICDALRDESLHMEISAISIVGVRCLKVLIKIYQPTLYAFPFCSYVTPCQWGSPLERDLT